MPEIANVASGDIYKTAQPQKNISLADMLNLQKSSYELSKLKELYPAMIAGEQARSKKSQIEANLAEQIAPLEVKTKEQSTESSKIDLLTKTQQTIANGYISKIFDPMVVEAAKDPTKIDKNKLVQNITKWGIQQGQEAGIDQQTAVKLIQPYIDIAQNDPAHLQDYLKQRHILGLTPESRTSALTPSGIAVNTGAGGQTVNTNPFSNVPQGQAIPGTQYEQQIPKQIVDVKGNKYIVNNEGKLIQVGTGQESMQPNANVNPAHPKLVQIDKTFDYTGPGGSQMQLNDYQTPLYENGQKEFSANTAQQAQSKEQLQNINGVYENLGAAFGNKPAQILRGGVRGVFGSETADKLEKNIMRVYLSNADTFGKAATDQARADQQVVSGSKDITEGALKDIISRAGAVAYAQDAYTKGLKQFRDKYGEVNGSIHTNNYKSTFMSNYDTRIFQMDSIAISSLPEVKKKEEISRIYNSIPKDQRKEFDQKYENIHRLEQGKFQ